MPMTLTPDDIQAIGEFMGVVVDEKIRESESRLGKTIQESESRVGQRIESSIQESESRVGQKIDFLAGEVRKIDQKQDIFTHQFMKHEERMTIIEEEYEKLPKIKPITSKKKS